MKGTLAVFVFFCLALGTAHATVYYGDGSGTSGKIMTALAWFEDEGCTIPAGVTPKDNDGNTYVIVYSNVGKSKFTSTSAFPDTPLVFGSPGAPYTSKPYSPSFNCNGGVTFTFPRLTVYGCNSFPANSTGTSLIKGNVTFVNAPGCTIKFGASGIGDTDPRGFDYAGTFVSESDVTVIIETGLNTSSGNKGTGQGVHRLSGDFSAFKGCMNYTSVSGGTAGTAELSLQSATALGDTSFPRADALKLGHRLVLTIDPVVKQGVERGIAANLSGINQTNYLRAVENASWTLSAPYAGEKGTLAKIDKGRVVFAGTMGMTNIVVKEGSLVLGSTVTFAAGTRITVESGAKLISQIGANIPNVTLNVLDGGSFSFDFTSPYDGSTNVTLDMTSLTQDDWNALVTPVPVQLSQAITQPFSTTQTFAIARFPKALGVKAADFQDATPTTYGLPVTRLEVVSEADADVLNLVATPVLHMVAPNVSNGNALLAEGKVYDKSAGKPMDIDVWSDGLPAHPGADYVVTNKIDTYTGVGWTDKFVFLGDSLSYPVNGAKLRSRARSMAFNKLVLYADSGLGSFGCNYNVYPHVVTGALEVRSSYAAPSVIEGSSDKTASTPRYSAFDIRARISGDGFLHFTGTAFSPMYLRGDNSAWNGGQRLAMSAEDSGKTVDVPLRFDCAEALGGPLAVRDIHALRFEAANNGLEAISNVVLDTVNRGIYIDNVKNVFFKAQEGVEFALYEELRLTGDKGFRKTGAGTLALGTPFRLGPDANMNRDGKYNRVFVEEGALKFVAYPAETSNCFGPQSFVLTVSEGARLTSDADPTDATLLQYGMKLTQDDSIAIKGEHLLIAVDFGPETRKIVEERTYPVLTVKTAVADAIESKLAVYRNFRGGKATIERTDGEDGFATFSLHYEPQGLAIILQ